MTTRTPQEIARAHRAFAGWLYAVDLKPAVSGGDDQGRRQLHDLAGRRLCQTFERVRCERRHVFDLQRTIGGADEGSRPGIEGPNSAVEVDRAAGEVELALRFLE